MRASLSKIDPRPILKAVTWRVWGSADTLLLAWMITGELSSAGAIAGVEACTKLALYVAHEKAWGFFGGAKPAGAGEA